MRGLKPAAVVGAGFGDCAGAALTAGLMRIDAGGLDGPDELPGVAGAAAELAAAGAVDDGADDGADGADEGAGEAADGARSGR